MKTKQKKSRARKMSDNDKQYKMANKYSIGFVQHKRKQLEEENQQDPKLPSLL